MGNSNQGRNGPEHAEDLALKAASAYFKEELIGWLGMPVGPYLELKRCIMAAVLTAGGYLVSMYFVQRKTRKMDVAECPKEQRE